MLSRLTGVDSSPAGGGIRQPSEQCDDGDLPSGDGCISTCQPDCGQVTAGSPDKAPS